MKTLKHLTPTAQPVGLFCKQPRAGQRERMSLNALLDYAIMTLMVAIALVLAAPLGVVMLWQTRTPVAQAPVKPLVKLPSEQRNTPPGAKGRTFPSTSPSHTERLTLL